MLAFTDKASYLEKRAAWRARQKAMEARIRELKFARSRRGGRTIEEKSAAQYQAAAWRQFAHAALLERAQMKRQSAAQREAVRAARDAA